MTRAALILPNHFRLLWLLPVAVFYSLLICFGQNIPTADDFQATLNFVYAYFFTNKNTHERWLLLFSQHNEHRILVSRLTTLALYELTGRVNLLTLLWVQQLFWLSFVGLIARLGQSVRLWQSGWLGLPVVLLLFHPNTYETLLNVWGGSQTYPTLLFTVVSLCALHQSTRQPQVYCWMAIAIGAGGLATFSFGSGFLVWLGGAVYLLYCRRFSALFAWLLAAALLLVFYLWQYERPIHSAALMIQPGSVRLWTTLKFILLFPGAPFMAIWPSPTLTFIHLLVCYGIGARSWLYACRLLATGYGSRHPLLFSLLSVSLATCVLLGITRNGLGTNGALISRYQVFANTIPLILYLIWVSQSAKSGRLILSYGCGVLLLAVHTLTLWQLWPALTGQYAKKERGLVQWSLGRTLTLGIEAAQQQAASEQLAHCIKVGIFDLPPAAQRHQPGR